MKEVIKKHLILSEETSHPDLPLIANIFSGGNKGGF
jgi:hypothetical protein